LLESLRHDRQLFIDGKRVVEDVTTDPRFAGAAQSLAELGDWIVGGGCRRPADDVARDGRGRNAPGRAVARRATAAQSRLPEAEAAYSAATANVRTAQAHRDQTLVVAALDAAHEFAEGPDASASLGVRAATRSVCWSFGEGTFAGKHGNGRDAPLADRRPTRTHASKAPHFSAAARSTADCERLPDMRRAICRCSNRSR